MAGAAHDQGAELDQLIDQFLCGLKKGPWVKVIPKIVKDIAMPDDMVTHLSIESTIDDPHLNDCLESM